MNYRDCAGLMSEATARRFTTATLRLVLAALSLSVTSCSEAPDLKEIRPAALSSSAEESSQGGTALAIASHAVELDGSTIYLGSGRDLIVLRRDGKGSPQPVTARAATARKLWRAVKVTGRTGIDEGISG